MLEGVDKFGNLFASVLCPPAPAAAGDVASPAAGPESLAELLLKAGLAKVRGRGQACNTGYEYPVCRIGGLTACVIDLRTFLSLSSHSYHVTTCTCLQCVEWSLNILSGGTGAALALRRVEQGAKDSKLGLWQGYVPTATNHTKLSSVFNGRVVEVVSGDCVVVKDKASGVERRINLSR